MWYCDDFSINIIDISMLDIDYALYECTLHSNNNGIDKTIFYNDIFNGQ